MDGIDREVGTKSCVNVGTFGMSESRIGIFS